MLENQIMTHQDITNESLSKKIYKSIKKNKFINTVFKK